MSMSSRAALAAGLSLVGLVGLVGRSHGQQDRSVQKTTTAPAAPQAIPAATIGSVDIEEVFKKYEKVEASSKKFQADAMAKQQELTKIAAEGKTATEMLQKLTPGTPDYKKTEDQVSQLKATLQAKQEQAQNEFAQREAEALASLYKEIQQIVEAVAKQKRLTFVVKVSKQPVSGSEPNSVMATMSRAVVYSDPTTDITNDVVYHLNNRYRAAVGSAAPGAPAPASSSPAPAPATAAGAGASRVK